jgi:flagellar motility protein MotE (MotC chaperone)
LQYCESVRDAAAEARFAFQAAQLEALAKQIDDRLARIEARSAELKVWIAKRESFTSQATAHLVGIFATMRPEAASEQLVQQDASTAAAILSKLEPRVASAILNYMPADKAARLASILAGAARKLDNGGRP